jgi:hypothetical protein
MLYALDRVGERAHDRAPIVLRAPEIARLREEWRLQQGTAPDAAAERALIERAIDDEVLYREALARGLDRSEPIVAARLAGVGEADGDIVRALAGHDVVIRRHLVQTMRLVLGAPLGAERPTPEDLRALLARDGRDFVEPATTSLTHVYLSRERRGAVLARDAAALLAALRAGSAARGDPFLHGDRIDEASAHQLERLFGPGFVEALASAPVRAWAGPFASTFGLHLVWVHDRRPARVPPIDAVETRLMQRWLAERRAARARERLQDLRRRYEIRIEAPFAAG